MSPSSNSVWFAGLFVLRAALKINLFFWSAYVSHCILKDVYVVLQNLVNLN